MNEEMRQQAPTFSVFVEAAAHMLDAFDALPDEHKRKTDAIRITVPPVVWNAIEGEMMVAGRRAWSTVTGGVEVLDGGIKRIRLFDIAVVECRGREIPHTFDFREIIGRTWHGKNDEGQR